MPCHILKALISWGIKRAVRGNKYSSGMALGMPDTDVLEILTITCKTTGTELQTEQITRKEADGWYYANKMHRKM